MPATQSNKINKLWTKSNKNFYTFINDKALIQLNNKNIQSLNQYDSNWDSLLNLKTELLSPIYAGINIYPEINFTSVSLIAAEWFFTFKNVPDSIVSSVYSDVLFYTSNEQEAFPSWEKELSGLEHPLVLPPPYIHRIWHIKEVEDEKLEIKKKEFTLYLGLFGRNLQFQTKGVDWLKVQAIVKVKQPILYM